MQHLHEIPPALVERFTRVDGRREVALVVGDPGHGEFVAVGRFAPIPGTSNAEFALVVADAWQHRGLGRALLERLCRAARAAGYAALHGYVLADNRDMIQLAAKLGFTPVERDGAALVLSRQLK